MPMYNEKKIKLFKRLLVVGVILASTAIGFGLGQVVPGQQQNAVEAEKRKELEQQEKEEAEKKAQEEAENEEDKVKKVEEKDLEDEKSKEKPSEEE